MTATNSICELELQSKMAMSKVSALSVLSGMSKMSCRHCAPQPTSAVPCALEATAPAACESSMPRSCWPMAWPLAESGMLRARAFACHISCTFRLHSFRARPKYSPHPAQPPSKPEPAQSSCSGVSRHEEDEVVVPRRYVNRLGQSGGFNGARKAT